MNDESLSIFEKVFNRHKGNGRKIILDFEGLIHIGRAGKAFLRQFLEQTAMKDLPKYLIMELGETRNQKNSKFKG